MPPFRIPTETRLQHHLMDTGKENESISTGMTSSLSSFIQGCCNIGSSLIIVALWATAIYLIAKGLYLFFLWTYYRLRSLRKPSSKDSLRHVSEKDIEAMHCESVVSPMNLKACTPDLISSPMLGENQPSFRSSGSSLQDFSPKNKNKLGIYIDHSNHLSTTSIPRVLSDGYTEYYFEPEDQHPVIKTQWGLVEGACTAEYSSHPRHPCI